MTAVASSHKPKSNKKSTKTTTHARAPLEVSNQEPAGGLALATAIDHPDLAGAKAMVRLQRAAGNRAVNRLLGARSRLGGGPGGLQLKLTVGPAQDSYEQEADDVAERVLRMPAPAPAVPSVSPGSPLPGDAVPELEEEEPTLQREHAPGLLAAGAGNPGEGNGQPAEDPPPSIRRRFYNAQRQADPRAGFEADASVERELAGRAGQGNPLPDSTRDFMEPRFGVDLSGVRVHTGNSADHLNRKLSAQAFTHGADIYFGHGKYNPGTTAGNRLLAHELTHVVQQGAAAPVRRKFRSGAHGRVQRALTAESTRAFDSAASASAKYEHGRKLANKYATPVAEPKPGDPPPWQTMVATELDQDNLSSDEQDKINKIGRTHGLKFWKKSDEQEKKLKDFTRAFMLWDFASRTNQLRPEDSAKYGKLEPHEKAKKRKAYMTHAKPFQEKFKGLVDKGPSAPESQAFLEQEGFLKDMAISDKQQAKAQTKGPRIDVRSTFIGGPILGIHLRAHLFIVYTGRDGKQFYFRGGPGENLDPNDPTELGYTTADYGEYAADTVDYDPSAPSVTVLSGDAAEAKLDAMIEAAKSVNSMRVPYVAQVETKTQKKFKESKFAKKYQSAGEFIGEALGIFGTRGENCNRAAWTILNRAGVPTRKPMGKHPGWGAPLGSDTPGKQNAMPKAEADDPSAAKKIKLDPYRDMAAGGQVQVYVDRMLFQKSDTLPVDTEVEELADEAGYRKIKYGDGKVGYIAKRTSDQRRTLRMKLKAALIAKNWYTPEEFQKMDDELRANNFGRMLELLKAVNMDRDYESIEQLVAALEGLIVEFGKPAEKLFRKRLDAMTESQIRALKHDYHEMRGMIDETGIEAGEAIKQVEARIGKFDRRDKAMRAIGEWLRDNAEISLWVNHYPDYETVREIAREASDDEDYILEVLDSLRPPSVRGHFIEDLFAKTDFEILKKITLHPETVAKIITLSAAYLGVPEQFFIKRCKERYDQKLAKLQLKAKEKQKAELPKDIKGYDPKDFPSGKHKWALTEPKEVMVSATPEGEANIKYVVDPKLAGPRVAVMDEWTRDYGRGRLEHNGKTFYIDLAVVFGAPKSTAKKEEAPKSTSPFEGLLTPPKDQPIEFFELSGSSELTDPVRIKIMDEDYKMRDGWQHTFIMVDRRAGNVYAEALHKYFKSDAEAMTSEKPSDEGAKEVEKEGAQGVKAEAPLTEKYPAGKYDWPWEEPIKLHVARLKGGPMDEEMTFLPTGKYKQLMIKDDLTLETGQAVLYYNGGMFYVALSEISSDSEDDVEEVLDETPDVVDEDVDEPEKIEAEAQVDEDIDPEALPISEVGLQALGSGADLQMLAYSFGLQIDAMKQLSPIQLERLAKIMGKSVEAVREEINDLI